MHAAKPTVTISADNMNNKAQTTYVANSDDGDNEVPSAIGTGLYDGN